MKLSEFNEATPGELTETLAACAPIPSWRAAILARRPYDSVEELTTTAAELAQDWTDLEVDGALEHHPRIGEKVQGSSREAEASRREQGSLGADEAAQAEWVSANEAYEQRFDRIFLIRAAGRSDREMRTQLALRLQNTEEEEAVVRRQQLAEIAVLRLGQVVS
ncbi:2-oxo-4-hydroxy-4-carboxy-5-ureidoimidazoline decarboxylase [Nesterenkonia halotolerans]|uniref:2-oxo-4-hydroxy-4-carboxy-5-ureidoimidazoline decarboxylase n=1 Tax=Nesterenkonia halotolerans TaxID=225325 RepID=A0ABR9J686_9MICC|nr:2-oxo-4-hydroxy-4-carboxy-5-ureidoimidazoline decarboxylase [Nesterenkonia halotolerans]MBE1514503.1 2-oxo-4-hydroxy-4-carboxy-5-ureidoimidazoline decarboxylase [Nesterenkonia halotolerans]